MRVLTSNKYKLVHFSLNRVAEFQVIMFLDALHKIGELVKREYHMLKRVVRELGYIFYS